MPWFPINQYIWDFWFLETQNQLHLFYLQAPFLDCHYNPEQRHNHSSIGHAVLTPWGWRELSQKQPVFAANSDKGTWDDLSIWTGSMIQHPQNKLYYFFYTARQQNEPLTWTPHELQRKQHIGLATSPDLNQWERHPQNPILPNPGQPFDGVAWRDPYVIQGEDGLYYAFICTRLQNTPLDAGGAIVYLVSDTLEDWENSPQILVTSSDFYQMEVPQVFWRRFGNKKRLYLLFSAQNRDCSQQRYQQQSPENCQTGTYYLYSELVPLEMQEFPVFNSPAELLASGLYAGKLLHPEKDNEPLFFGFHWEDESGQFGNGICDPLCCEFQEDGKILVRAF